jgi:eukaryotic-like serine/threonine-protein kinase
MEINESPDGDEQQLNQILAEFMEQIQNGRFQDPEAWIQQHPKFSTELYEFLKDHQELAARALELTLPVSGTELPELVRYVGDYELLSQIATGGMGIVFKARQRSLGRPVAVKMIRSGVFATENDVAGFRHEAAAAASLEHPNIVPIYEVGEHQGQHYFSMKLIEGGNLAAFTAQQPVTNLEQQRQLVRLLLPVVRAIGFAHDRGFIHRDLKPEGLPEPFATCPRNRLRESGC